MAARKNTQTRNGYFTLRFSSADAQNWDFRLSAAKNYVLTDGGKEGLMSEKGTPLGLIIEHGVAAIEKQIEDSGGKLTQATLIARGLKEARSRNAHKEHMTELYEAFGLDEYAAYSTKNALNDWEEIATNYGAEHFEQQIRPWAERALEWLGDYLAERPQQIDHIKTAAVAAGIIDRDNVGRDWSKMTVLASREGFSSGGQRGWWGSVAR